MVDVDVVDFVNASLINATQELLDDPDFEDLARKSDGFVHIGVGVVTGMEAALSPLLTAVAVVVLH